MSDVHDRDLLEPAFRIDSEKTAGNEFDLDIPPTSGMEYLRRVQMEAQNCAHVVVADLDTRPFNAKQTVNVSQSSGIQPAPHGLAPDMSWQKLQTANFSSVRQKMARFKARSKKEKQKAAHRLPLKEDTNGWCRLCFGRVEPSCTKTVIEETEEMESKSSTTSMSSVTAEMLEKESDSSSCSSTSSVTEYYTGEGEREPLVSLIIQLDQATVVQVLEYHVNWFQATGFTKRQGEWFYALLSVLEKPLQPEACSLLRSLARNCASLRATVDKEDDMLPQLNLFITLVARYFDQGDLADNT